MPRPTKKPIAAKVRAVPKSVPHSSLEQPRTACTVIAPVLAWKAWKS